MISNVNIYRSIAEEAASESQRLDAAAKSPRPDGGDGHVVALDPQQSSFKRSLIAIAFAGMWLDALLFLVGVSRFGREEYLKIDKKRQSYEVKLSALGIADPSLLAQCTQFRETRNDLTHEKAIEPHELDSTTLRRAQHESQAAVAFVSAIAARLGVP
jgi:hypothetical protein